MIARRGSPLVEHAVSEDEAEPVRGDCIDVDKWVKSFVKEAASTVT